ncbi:hypothetical protein D3C81_1821010 [compost metagenome]
MFGMHQHGDGFKFIVIQPVQNTYTHIINPALHRTVHSGSMPVVVMLRSLGMVFFVGWFMVRFLK